MRKIILGLLIIGLLAVAPAMTTKAATIADIQASIASLRAQIEQLQQQLSALRQANRPTSTPPVVSTRQVQIKAITGPTVLRVNQKGTWKINLKMPPRSKLSMSIDWGDSATTTLAEKDKIYVSEKKKANDKSFKINHQLLSLAHSYSQAGNYTATFTLWASNATSSPAKATAVVNVVANPVATSTGNFTTQLCDHYKWLKAFRLICRYPTPVVTPPATTTAPTCQDLWWFDSTTSTSTCGHKSFCGTYMYQGLQTFGSQSSCQASLPITTATSTTTATTTP